MSNYHNTQWAVEEMNRARNVDKGRKLENNTRLFANEDGSYRVRLHNTDIVTINPDGTYTLVAGGYQTVTTLDRMRTYAPVRSTLFSDRGDWYLWMEPDANDPRPARVSSPVPAPFERPADYVKPEGGWHNWRESYYTEKRQREYDEMMERFNGDTKAWAAARKAEFAARRDYLKADKEWVE